MEQDPVFAKFKPAPPVDSPEIAREVMGLLAAMARADREPDARPADRHEKSRSRGSGSRTGK